MSTRITMLREREGAARRPVCLVARGVSHSDRSDGAASTPVAQSLDEVLVAAWAGLTAGAPIACPMCDAVMEPRWSAGAGAVGGRCHGCGTELS